MPQASATGQAHVTLRAPVRPGPAPALGRCTWQERAEQVFAVLAAGWSGYRGQPWSGCYARRLGGVAGLRSLRLALVDGPAVLCEAGFDGGDPGALRAGLGPLLDLVFTSGGGTPQPWAVAGTPAATIELRVPAASTAAAASAQDHALALHALADLQRLSALFATPEDAAALHAAALFLLPQLAFHADTENALAERLAETVQWLQAGPGDAHGLARPAFVAPAAAAVVQVAGKQPVMEVLLDAGNDCTVSGYAQRMQSSLGLIYLGLDQSNPQYALQSEASNRAIGAIGEDEAFTQALAATRGVLRALSAGASVNLSDVTTKVLAVLCTYWFDIPDGRNIVAGGRLFPLPFSAPTCPGQYAALSGSIFQPEPGAGMAGIGQANGKELQAAALKFVQATRAGGPKGVLARALFAAFPQSPQQDALLASTLIGVMMGFLPTAQGNLASVFGAWQGPKMRQLSQALLANPAQDLLQRARAIVRPPMIEAIQGKPVPPQVWRTAARDCTLAGQQVQAGDRLFINIDSAMKEDLGNGVSDVTPVFGGDRDRNPHPTHACPGLWMGMGVMLGVVTAVLEAWPSLPAATADAASAVY